MQLKRFAAVLAATLTVSVLGATAPAQADTSWGCGGHCLSGR